MKCLICGRTGWVTKFEYNKPDKYEWHQKIKSVRRSWLQCTRCGHYQQVRDYSLQRLERIYQGEYRSERFRKETIDKAFHRIFGMPYDQSENKQRYLWFKQLCSGGSVLDIGSGIGVWPSLLTCNGMSVACMEENKYSVEFITNTLELDCYKSLDKIRRRFSTITLLHVLEHIEKPVPFLSKIQKVMKAGGEIFIEVPDDSEFAYLDKDHDEFNSCHVHFYSMASLYKVLERSGFVVTDMHRKFYSYRGLTRIMARGVFKL
jgi:2-polyprenyl-3-methyl-5-hydroxy-6-metoxy-1,4-benzoquinol methylase